MRGLGAISIVLATIQPAQTGRAARGRSGSPGAFFGTPTVLRPRGQARDIPDSDEAFARLISGAKDGEHEAVEQIYRNHVALVYGYFNACGAHEPEDLTSEVFVGMLRNLDGFSGGQPEFRRWLMTIAYRRLIAQRRRRRLNKVELADPAGLGDSEGVGHATELRPAFVDPLLADEFLKLTRAQREVLALRFVADSSLHDVAEITGRPIGAVKSLQNRGLNALRRAVPNVLRQKEA